MSTFRCDYPHLRLTQKHNTTVHSDKKKLNLIPLAGNLSPGKIKLFAEGNSIFMWEKRLPGDRLSTTGKG